MFLQNVIEIHCITRKTANNKNNKSITLSFIVMTLVENVIKEHQVSNQQQQEQ
jgi:hypothetical protein